MTKNTIIGILATGLIATSALAIYKWFALDDHHIRTRPHKIEDANLFINNYINNQGGINKPVPENGWLVNSNELLPFVRHSAYLHISLARITPQTTALTLVISGVTSDYNHTFPYADIDGDGIAEPYVLETVHPCPNCFDLLTTPTPRAGYRVNDLLSVAPDALQLPR